MMRNPLKPVLTLVLTGSLVWPASAVLAASFQLQAAGGEPLYRSEIPLAVYHSARQDGLADITLHNGAGERVPHALVEYSVMHPAASPSVSTRPLPLFALTADTLNSTTASGAEQLRIQLQKNADTTTVSIASAASQASAPLYLLDAGAKHTPISKLTLDWTQNDAGMIALEVLASDDLIHWSSVGHGVLLKTSNTSAAIVQNSLTLDQPSSAHYLQLRNSGQTQGFTLTGAQAHFSTQVSTPPPLLWQALGHAKRRDDEKTGVSTIQFEASGRYPAAWLRIPLADDNTIASVRVTVRNRPDQPWRPLSSAALYRVTQTGADGHSSTLSNADIAIPVTVARYWQLQFSQATGSIGASSPGLALGWPVQTLVWNARGSAPFTLQTGSASSPNRVTIATLMPDFKPEQLAQLPVAVIAPVPTPDTSAATATTTWDTSDSAQDQQRWWLWGGLALGVLVLAGMAVSLLKSGALAADKSQAAEPSSTQPGSSSTEHSNS